MLGRIAVLLSALVTGGCMVAAQPASTERTYQRVDGKSLADAKLKAEMQAIGRQCLAAAHNAAKVQPVAPVISQQTTVNIGARRDPHIGFITSTPRIAPLPSVTRDAETLDLEMSACMARNGYVLR